MLFQRNEGIGALFEVTSKINSADENKKSKFIMFKWVNKSN